ncbi:right-handed parallel beta-helix repeat-containing protein [Subsaxibacter sp. CAU 1640]|uniref:right-handed parallel beta-helix repeat-containing protein n=1 Tax=Subsaxibacter sp. CAU 1640 TaxID=2933271 RepID=UPI0020042F3C|nr:right-handed parallel beta-helix repeat-containing protein [Subsaxibacter sp. CAU 1640]MCK7591513.1 right-handed parallel beta-helix repeat-containing protein [Subsaxibacter sp. CAU 1640]
MKQHLLHIFFGLLSVWSFAQNEFHVTTNGKPSGNGTLQNPWDLQTALSQKPEVINGDDTIWLHGGIYNGRFLSTIKSTKEGKFITVAPYQQQKVTLNGNAESTNPAVLNVRGGQVIFRDFEITWLGSFSRDEKDINFKVGGGINHTSGEDCRFYNLVIHNNPGLGIGSWKQTGGTIIENCFIYHNGYVAKDGKGRGEGMYVQNASDKTRIIRNNIIFGNYYKAVEVWSAGRNATFDFVKNIILQDNIIFNSGLPTGNYYDNIIIATDDRNGTNRAKNIQVLNNVLYHNTDYLANQVNGDGPSLTLGYVDNSPVEDIMVKDNFILGRNNALRLLHVNSMTFTGNKIYGGYVFLNANEMQYTKNWKMDNNHYYSKKATPFRVNNDKNYKLQDWNKTFDLDNKSKWNKHSEFDLQPVLILKERSQQPNSFNLALFDKEGKEVMVDFSKYHILKGSSYRIYDVENRTEVLASGVLGEDKKIKVAMDNVKFVKPLHNDKAEKTLSNFGAYIIEFETNSTSSVVELSAFERFLKWLGF